MKSSIEVVQTKQGFIYKFLCSSPPVNLLTAPFAGLAPFFSSRSYECMNESRLVVSKADYMIRIQMDDTI